MMGILEEVLRERYGEPHVVSSTDGVEYRWNEEHEPLRCVLYKSDRALHSGSAYPLTLQRIYGDATGACLLQGSVKVAVLGGAEVYGLYMLDELVMQPEVQDAARDDPVIDFFMDAANVWFYGAKGDELYVYDAGTGELDSLGPVRKALWVLLEEWEQAKA